MLLSAGRLLLMSTTPSTNDCMTREMSISHREFFRLLPRAVNDAPVSRQGNQVDIKTECRCGEESHWGASR